MDLRKIKADKIFDGKVLHEGKILVVAHNGSIEAIVDEIEAGNELEIHQGILMPGFINAHCHLELSHLKGAAGEGNGLVDFLVTVMDNRKEIHPDKFSAIEAAEKELYNNGINGVADICNTTDAIAVKENSSIRWHSLIEVLNLRDATLPQRWQQFQQVKEAHIKKGLPATLTPHSPYSISPATFQAINADTKDAIVSVHNQETKAEDELFKKGGGDFLKLYEHLGHQGSPIPVSGRSSLQTWLSYFTEGQTIILVHNTFINEADIIFASEHAHKYGLNLFYCTCPNANWYIEKQLPPVELLIKNNCRIIIGTDSYSSNYQLSIAAEIEMLRKHFPTLPLQTILQWATANGAKAMQWNDLGHFQKGSNPGVILLNEIDLSVKRLA